jgi:hypothetical protein
VTPSLLSGQTLRFDAAPIYRDYPRNVFALLGGAGYAMHVGEASLLCPHRLCPQNPRHPPPHDPARVLRELADGRVARLDAWLRGVGAARRPTFFFKHLLLPHRPWQFLPSGKLYKRGVDNAIPGMDFQPSFRDRWFLIQAYQRHLLQAVWTDRLVGKVLSRLRAAGLYDRSLVVVTADNGEAFLHAGSDTHRSDAQTYTDIASTPLLIKRPFEHGGGYSRRHVRTIDIVPTIAGVVGVRIPWRLPGRSAFDLSARVSSRVVVFRNDRRQLFIGQGGYTARARQSLEQKIQLFGDRSIDALYAAGPFRELLGRASPTCPSGAGGASASSSATEPHSPRPTRLPLHPGAPDRCDTRPRRTAMAPRGHRDQRDRRGHIPRGEALQRTSDLRLRARARNGIPQRTQPGRGVPHRAHQERATRPATPLASRTLRRCRVSL